MGNKRRNYRGLMPLKYKIQEEVLREALKQGKYGSHEELYEVTGLSAWITNATMKRCGLTYKDVFNKTTHSKRLAQIIKLLPDAESTADLARLMGLTRQRVEQLTIRMDIKEVLSAYFRLKRLNEALDISDGSSYEDIIVSSTSFVDIASKVNKSYHLTLKFFSVMFGDKWDMMKDMLFEYWGWDMENRKGIQYWLNKHKQFSEVEK